MAFKTESKIIGGLEYKVSQLGAIKGRTAFLRLVKALGPVVGGLVDPKGAPRQSLDLADMFGKLALTDADLTYFCDIFSEKTFVVKGSQMPRLDNVFDDHFAGRYLDMVQWLAFCVQVNFADFFGGALIAAVDPASPSAPTQPADVLSR